MKIIFYTDQLYLHGGIEKMLSQKLNYFSEIKNYEVHLITFEQKNNNYCYNINNKVIKHDLSINYFREKSYFNINNLQKVPLHIKSLRKKLKEIEADIIIIANYSFDFYFLPFISGNIKTIKEYHSSRFNIDIKKKTLKGKLFYYLDEFINSRYDKVIVLNKDEKKHFTTQNVEIIPNSIEIDNFNLTPTRNKTIISAGRMAPVKQFQHLIKAWNLISKSHPDWNVEIYGGGDKALENELKELIKKMNIPRITIMGATNNLNEIMKNSSIYALMSLTECFPMVLLESLKNGLPIISYDCPYGPKNIITNGDDGLLVEPNNIKVFADKLSFLIMNTEKRVEMQDNALKNSKHFSEDIIMKKWINLFDKI